MCCSHTAKGYLEMAPVDLLLMPAPSAAAAAAAAFAFSPGCSFWMLFLAW
jgi:hypothetical protein